jgi:hypothetical protein
MKTIILTLLVFISYFTCQAQTDTFEHTHCCGTFAGGFGGPYVKLTSIGSTPLLMIGGAGAWKFGSHFYLGGAGYNTVSDQNSITLDNKGKPLNTKFETGYGGLLLGSVFAVNDWLRLDLNLLIGGGGFSFADSSKSLNNGYFILEPGLNLGTAINHWFAVGIGVGQRFAGGGISPVSASAFNKPSLNINFYFGNF